MMKLGYTEAQIREKYMDEEDMIGKLYQRLLTLNLSHIEATPEI
jgi:hypothetical protein